MNRRSFLASVFAAVAMSPLLCRMAKMFHVEQPDVPIEEMQSTWDGTLSPYFTAKYQWHERRFPDFEHAIQHVKT